MNRRYAWAARGWVIGLALGLFQSGGAVDRARAQDKPEEKKRVLEIGKWYPSLESGVTLTQSSYSDNWRGGDKGSVVWTFITSAGLENQLHPKVNWNNTLKMAFGQTHQQQARSDNTRNWVSPIKSTDLLDFESISRFTLGGLVDPFAAVRLESQFLDASDPAGRTLSLNPWRFRESAGIARRFLDEEERTFQSRVGFTLRQSLRRYFPNAAPDRATQSESANDGGFELVTDGKSSVLEKRVSWTGKVTLYQPVFYSGRSDLDKIGLHAISDYSMAMDADFENIFTSQITKIVSVNLYIRWLYDRYDNSVKPIPAGEIDPTGSPDDNLENPADVRAGVRKAGQFKQTLGIGITYRFV